MNTEEVTLRGTVGGNSYVLTITNRQSMGQLVNEIRKRLAYLWEHVPSKRLMFDGDFYVQSEIEFDKEVANEYGHSVTKSEHDRVEKWFKKDLKTT